MTYEIQIYLLFAHPRQSPSIKVRHLHIHFRFQRKINKTLFLLRRFDDVVVLCLFSLLKFPIFYIVLIIPTAHCRTKQHNLRGCCASILFGEFPKQPQHVDGDDGNQRMNIKQLKCEERGTCWLYSHHSTQREHRKEQHRSRKKNSSYLYCEESMCMVEEKKKRDENTRKPRRGLFLDRLHLSMIYLPHVRRNLTPSALIGTHTQHAHSISRSLTYTPQTQQQQLRKMKTRSINSTTHQLCL